MKFIQICMGGRMGILFQDLRFTFRQFRNAPSFTVTAVLTLALGIGANTAIFSLVNSLLLKPLPVENPQQIATLAYRQNHGALQRPISLSEFKEIRVHAGNSFSDVFAVTAGLDGFSTEGRQPERITTAYVSGNFFPALGVEPAAGRLFCAAKAKSSIATQRLFWATSSGSSDSTAIRMWLGGRFQSMGIPSR
jgi:hypothetical protein